MKNIFIHEYAETLNIFLQNEVLQLLNLSIFKIHVEYILGLVPSKRNTDKPLNAVNLCLLW